jgi:hypothetical protein
MNASPSLASNDLTVDSDEKIMHYANLASELEGPILESYEQRDSDKAQEIFNRIEIYVRGFLRDLQINVNPSDYVQEFIAHTFDAMDKNNGQLPSLYVDDEGERGMMYDIESIEV